MRGVPIEVAVQINNIKDELTKKIGPTVDVQFVEPPDRADLEFLTDLGKTDERVKVLRAFVMFGTEFVVYAGPREFEDEHEWDVLCATRDGAQVHPSNSGDCFTVSHDANLEEFADDIRDQAMLKLASVGEERFLDAKRKWDAARGAQP